MDTTRIAEVFRTVYNGQMNFMTPALVKFRKSGNLLVEVSQGTGIMPGTTIYGVTVLEIADHGRASDEDWESHYISGLGWIGVKRRNDLSCAQESMRDVNNYINERIKGNVNA